MPNAVDEVLNQLGWGDGFRIPVANEENKRLEEEIERKSRQRASLRGQLESLRERTSDVRKHATDLRQEQSQKQRLLAARSAQVESERQAYQLARMEESRLRQEIKRCEREAKEADAKAETMGQTLARLTHKLEASKCNIKLEKESLLEWEERLNRKEERNLVIEQFVKSDEKTFKKIELERQKLSEEAENYRQTVVKADADIRELELMLDKTARFYSQALKDRRQLMDQWSQSVRVLTQRDKAIYEALQEINSLRGRAKERMDAYQEAERFYNIQVAENRELEDGIKMLEKDFARQREERVKLASTIDAISIELLAKNKELQQLARRTTDTRANTKRKRAAVEEKKMKLEDCKKRIGELKETLKNIDVQTMTVEEKSRQLQDMLEKEEKRKAVITREIKRQQDLILRASTRLKDLENELKLTRMQQQAESKRWDQLQSEKTRQEKLTREAKQFAYQADIELQQCETRLSMLLGQERDKDELEAKQSRLEQLERTLRDKSETYRMLQAQVAQVDNEVRKMSNSIASNNEELQQLRSKREELRLLLEGGEKQLKAAQSSCEDRQVEESILRLKLREAEKLASKVDDKLYDLEKFALEMEAAMQERKAEIKVQKESLTLQKRLIQADCAELRSLLTERRSRIQQLQARYDILIASIGTNPEDGKPLDATYLKIQSAQERYLLQERGDHLDRTIRKTEYEIQSMENTLRLVNACNAKYKSSLSLVDDAAPEKTEQRQLDEELYQTLETLRQKRQALERAQQDVKRMEENCEQLKRDIERAQEEKETKRQTVTDIENQITEQQEKISRADKNLRKILKDIQKKCVCTSDETILLQERDIAVRELQEQNQLALQRIAEFTIRHVEVETYVRKRLEVRGISMPAAYYLKQPSSRCESLVSASSGKLTHRDTLPRSVVQIEPQFDDLNSAKSSKVSSRSTQKQLVGKNVK